MRVAHQLLSGRIILDIRDLHVGAHTRLQVLPRTNVYGMALEWRWESLHVPGKIDTLRDVRRQMWISCTYWLDIQLKHVMQSLNPSVGSDAKRQQCRARQSAVEREHQQDDAGNPARRSRRLCPS